MGCIVLLMIVLLVVGLTAPSATSVSDWVWIVGGVLVVLGLISMMGRSSSYFNPFEGKPPMTAALHFRCAEHNYQKLVPYYNPDDPPTCPACGKTLIKGGLQ